jgi:formate-dependent nitrite reductase membrane component NrfD
MNSTLFNGELYLLIVKILLLGSLIVFNIFCLILLQQVKVKRDTVSTRLGPFLELIAWLLLVLSIMLTVYAFVLLI